MQKAPPVVDLKPFTNPAGSSDKERAETAKELIEACKSIGFVYIRHHAVRDEDLARAFAISKRFFGLPMEQKQLAPHPPGWTVHRGYSRPGLEKVSNASGEKDDADMVALLRKVQDYKESYEIGSEENPDMPNVWLPDDILPEWRPFMASFYWTCWSASKIILEAIAQGLGLESQHLLKYHSGDYNQLRLLHYPPVPATAIEHGSAARMPAHSDWSVFTILFQDDCGGLQVESSDEPGTFIDVDPIPGTLVFNVGDLLMRWTNDHLKSTQHRVGLPPRQDRLDGDARMTRARYSIPYFVTVDPDTLIEPLCFTVGQSKYEPITQRDYAAMRASMQY